LLSDNFPDYFCCWFVENSFPEASKMNSRRKLLLGLGIAGGGLCLISCVVLGALFFIFPSAYNAKLSSSSLQIGETAPDFQLETLSGETVSLSQFRGRPVLLTLGATWCPDCWREAPLLQRLHERQSNLVILMIDSKEDAQTCRNTPTNMG